MIYTYVATALISASMAGVGTWKVQSWRHGAYLADQLTAVREKEKLDRLVENRMSGTVIGALNESKTRETVARRDAAGAMSERDGLRNDLAQLRKDLPSLAANACRKRADTLGELLDQCASAHQSLAGAADRHASDRLTLEQAWPK